MTDAEKKEFNSGNLTVSSALDRDGDLSFQIEAYEESSTEWLAVKEIIRLRDHLNGIIQRGDHLENTNG